MVIFVTFDRWVAISTLPNAYSLRIGDFCAYDNDDDDNDDKTDYFTPCACARGKYKIPCVECAETCLRHECFRYRYVRHVLSLTFHMLPFAF